jgi:hypothetical protein
MKIIERYIARLVALWIVWFWFPALDLLSAVVDTFVPGFNVPRLWYWAIPAIGFVVVNVKLFADQEAEKQALQMKLDEYEDTRADIRFKKFKDYVHISYSQRKSPFSDLDVAIEYHTHLDKNGMPGWIIIGALLKGMKKSEEPGDIHFEIAEWELPKRFEIDQHASGDFRWQNHSPIHRLEKWYDDFQALFELPVKIRLREDVQIFASDLHSLGNYRIVIRYHTSRGIDSESKQHELVLSGDFRELQHDLCKKWTDWNFPELAKLANCS